MRPRIRHHHRDHECEHLQGIVGAEEQLEVVSNILKQSYGVDVGRNSSQSCFLTAWRAGEGGLETPVTEAELFRWSGARFPNLPANTVRGWLDAEGLVAETCQGTLFFSARPCVGDEGFLRSSMESGQPVSLQTICAGLNQSEHTVRNRLSRYTRLLPSDQKPNEGAGEDATTVESDAEDEAEEEEATQYIYSEHYGFVRCNGAWCVRVSQGKGSRLNLTALPLTNLAHLIVGGLTEQDIWDASVWGVHEYVSRRLHEIYRVSLLGETNPFALARMLVRTTRVGNNNGLIRTMRRRRLRWDPKDAPRARGKLGWIVEVLHRCGQPLTAEELSVEMSRVYQVYNDYSYMQLPTTTAAGEQLNFARLAGNSTRRPVLFVHNAWAPNANGSNVSEGVRAFINQVVSAPSHLRYAQSELLDARLIQLCERAAGRSLEWAAEPPPLLDSGSNDSPTA